MCVCVCVCVCMCVFLRVWERELIYVYAYMLKWHQFTFSLLELYDCIYVYACVVYWPSTRPNMPLQSDSPEGGDTFRWQLWEEIA